MGIFFTRLTGLLLLLGAILGALLAGYGLYTIWRIEPVAADSLTETIDLLDTTLTTTADSTLLINNSVVQMKDNLEGIRLSLDNASSTMHATAGVTSSVADLIGKDFNSVVLETQISLASVQNSARMIDNTLSIISGIPLIGPSLSGGYRRDMPLETSIREVSESLAPVPDSLVEIQGGLQQTAVNFELMRQDLDDLVVTLDEIEEGLSSAETLMGDYQALFANTQERLERARTAVPKVVRGGLLMGAAFFIWLMIAQVALLAQASNLLASRRVVVTPAPLEIRERNPE